MRAWRLGAIAVMALAYPLAIYLLLVDVLPAWFAAVLVLWLIVRAWKTGEVSWWLLGAATAVLAVISLFLGELVLFKFYPVLVNGTLLTVFGLTLLHPPSMVERIARLGTPDLPPEGVLYTRRVTQVWCVFFLGNGGIALATALWASNEMWVLYNGFIAYLLTGLLFGVEWMVRPRLDGERKG